MKTFSKLKDVSEKIYHPKLLAAAGIFFVVVVVLTQTSIEGGVTLITLFMLAMANGWNNTTKKANAFETQLEFFREEAEDLVDKIDECYKYADYESIDASTTQPVRVRLAESELTLNYIDQHMSEITKLTIESKRKQYKSKLDRYARELLKQHEEVDNSWDT